MFFPDWTSFAYKYRGREQSAFEDLARTLFRRELGVSYGLFQRVNHKGNETDVVNKDGKIIGFQAKFFKDDIDEDNIIHSMIGAKENNPEQTHYYIYSNLTFGLPKRRKRANGTNPKREKTQKEEKIINIANELGLTVVWKLDKAILDEANEADWIRDVFFNVEGRLEGLITEEIKHTETAFANIGYTCQFHNQSIHIPRTRAIEHIEAMSASSLYVIHGEGGCGKTAILHEFLEKHRDEYPIYYRKASVLNVNSLMQVFHQGNPYTMEDFKRAYKDCPKKYFIVDSAEHLEAMDDETIIPTLIRMLIEEGWCLVFTVRNVFLSDLLNFLSLNLRLKDVPTLSIELLTEKELTSISFKYGIQLPIDANLKDRLRNLFYLNLYTQYYDEINDKTDDRGFFQFIWEKKIRGKDNRKGYIRENEFEAFVEEMVKTGQFFLSPNKFVSEEFYSLIEDEVIAMDSVHGLFITHDIFEEWGLYRIVEKIWQNKATLYGFLAELGVTQSIRRAFRIWLKDKVKEDINAIKPLVQIAFSGEVTSLWQDEVLCAILTSDNAKALLADVEDRILSNTDGFGDKVIWSLRVGCQYVKEVVKLNDYYWPRCVPIGSGWSYIIDLLFLNRTNLDITPWLTVLQDCTKSNNQSETTRKAGLMILEYYRSEVYEHSHYLDGVKELICDIFNNVAWAIRDELKVLLEDCMADDNLSDDLPEFILQHNSNALNIQMSLPETVAELCLHYWKEEDDDRHNYSYLGHSGDDFGIDEDRVASRYFPPGAFQTPTFALLVTDEKIGVDFIIRLMNECVEHYAHSGSQRYITKVGIRDEGGEKNWQWHSMALWGMYRGMDTSCYTLQAVHMALEKYMLNLSQASSYEQCEQIMKRLLFECHSSSVSAVAASLVLAYPEKYWKVALILFRTVEFIEIDNHRVLNEYTMNSSYGISFSLNPTVTKERLSTCEQRFRKTSLENICLNYQFFGNQRELGEEQGNALMQTIYAILDEHRKLLDGDGRQDLEILLSRMDRRRLKVKELTKVEGGYQIQFETELGEVARKVSDEAAVNQQEMYRYIGLLNWAMNKMKGEAPKEQMYGENWERVLKDAQSLQEELANGRTPYISDGYTITWVAPCLLKFFTRVLSEDGLKWCKAVVDEKLSEFKSLSNSMDGTTACIHVIPILIDLFPYEKDKYFNFLLTCLLAPDYGNNLSSRDCVTTAVQTFDLWKKEPDAMQDLVKRFIAVVEKDQRLDVVELNAVIGLTPNEPDDWMTAITVSHLRRIPLMIKKGESTIQSMFAVIGNLTRLFFRVDRQDILDCIDDTKPIVKEHYLGYSLLTQIIFEADSLGKADRFWMIWNSYRDMLPELLKRGSSQQFRTYLLNIHWNDGIKEWRCLRPCDIEFFDYISENCNGNTLVLECISKALTNIAYNYQFEGMGWISKIVFNYPSMSLSESNALFYLEQVMMEYVYANKMKIRQMPILHENVRKILNFMVSKNSVIGFVLRDIVN
jgi:hypothetical protein